MQQDAKEFTPPPRVEMPMPRIMRNGTREYLEYPGGQCQLLPKRKEEYKWASKLWPAFTWLLFGFHLGVVGVFFFDLFRGDYDMIKHIVIVATICVSYAAVAYIHNNIVRYYEDGRLE